MNIHHVDAEVLLAAKGRRTHGAGVGPLASVGRLVAQHLRPVPVVVTTDAAKVGDAQGVRPAGRVPYLALPDEPSRFPQGFLQWPTQQLHLMETVESPMFFFFLFLKNCTVGITSYNKFLILRGNMNPYKNWKYFLIK